MALRAVAYTARLTADGQIVGTYGYGGVYRYPGGSGGSVLRSLDVAGNNRLVLGLARVDTSGTAEHLLRLDATTGRLDATFGHNGIVDVPHRAVDWQHLDRARPAAAPVVARRPQRGGATRVTPGDHSRRPPGRAPQRGGTPGR